MVIDVISLVCIVSDLIPNMQPAKFEPAAQIDFLLLAEECALFHLITAQESVYFHSLLAFQLNLFE